MTTTFRMNSALRRLARLAGLQLRFVDTLDRTVIAEEESVRAVLGSMGLAADSSSSVRESLERLLAKHAGRLTDPVIVAHTGAAAEIPLNSRPEAPVDVIALDERGERVDCAREVVPAPGGPLLRLTGLEPGYFDLTIRAGQTQSNSRLIVAPRKTFAAGVARRWGLFAPAYALRGDADRGAGSYEDLSRIARWAGEQGAGCFGTLPLYASFLDALDDPSPYAPVSRLFWNEVYVPSSGRAPGAIDELVSWKQVAERHRQDTWNDAQAVFERGGSELEALLQYERSQPLVTLYASFRARTDTERCSWREWPDQSEGAVLAFVDTPLARWYRWAQWKAELSMASLASAGAGLYLDFPLGTNSDGFDVWRWRELYIDGVSVGAPPDLAYRQGQDWGFRAPHPHAMREEGWRHWTALIRRAMSHASMLRLDHVMGLHRMWWVPEGLGPSRGLYMHYAAEELYAILSVESHRAQCEIAGEDLGTVPPVVTRSMKAWGISGLWALERQLTHARNGRVGPIGSDRVASVGTHDMPPLASFLEGSDLEEKGRLGVIPAERVTEERARRPQLVELLREWIRTHGADAETLQTAREILDGVLRVLAQSRARWVIVNLEDLWLETTAQNVPTTTHERPNWRPRLKLSLEQIEQDPEVARSLQIVREGRK